MNKLLNLRIFITKIYKSLGVQWRLFFHLLIKIQPLISRKFTLRFGVLRNISKFQQKWQSVYLLLNFM